MRRKMILNKIVREDGSGITVLAFLLPEGEMGKSEGKKTGKGKERKGAGLRYCICVLHLTNFTEEEEGKYYR